MKRFLFIVIIVSLLSGCQTTSHEIKFDTGYDEIIHPVMVENGDTLDLPTITREGYQFLGWSVSQESDGALYNALQPVTTSFTLYAKWFINSYHITFDSQGGTLVNDLTALYEEPINPPEEPLKNGYEFIGWSLEKDSNVTYEFDTMPGHDVTLYAIWEEVTQTGASPNEAIYIQLDTIYEVFLDLNQSILFRFQPATSGFYTMESFGEFDTYVKVYQLVGQDDSSIAWEDLYQIEAEDDFGEGNNFKLSVEMSQNAIYFIQVEMFFMDTISGTIQFKLIIS